MWRRDRKKRKQQILKDANRVIPEFLKLQVNEGRIELIQPFEVKLPRGIIDYIFSLLSDLKYLYNICLVSRKCNFFFKKIFL